MQKFPPGKYQQTVNGNEYHDKFTVHPSSQNSVEHIRLHWGHPLLLEIGAKVFWKIVPSHSKVTLKMTFCHCVRFTDAVFLKRSVSAMLQFIIWLVLHMRVLVIESQLLANRKKIVYNLIV